MAEYIEKAALMGLIESEARRWGDDYDCWQCLADIEDFPSADVRPVVRGRWVYHPDATWEYECDKCGCYVPGEWNYCPDCGADMRETEE